MEEAIYQTIELFLSGGMSKEEALQFEKKINEDKELQSEVALYKAINFHLLDEEHSSASNSSYKDTLDTLIESKEGKAAKSKLLQIGDTYHNENQKKKAGKPKNRVIYFLIATAAVIAFIFGIFVVQGNESNTELYAEYYDSKELPSFIGRSDEESPFLSAAIEKFNGADYKASLMNFKTYVSETKEINPLLHIYTGIIQSELGNLEEAIKELEMLENAKIEDSSRALWYKALIYLKFDQGGKAKEVLSIITQNNSNYKYKEAKELLEKL